MHLFFMLFSSQCHEAPIMFGLKVFQTVYKRAFCEHSPGLFFSVIDRNVFKMTEKNAISVRMSENTG